MVLSFQTALETRDEEVSLAFACLTLRNQKELREAAGSNRTGLERETERERKDEKKEGGEEEGRVVEGEIKKGQERQEGRVKRRERGRERVNDERIRKWMAEEGG